MVQKYNRNRLINESFFDDIENDIIGNTSDEIDNINLKVRFRHICKEIENYVRDNATRLDDREFTCEFNKEYSALLIYKFPVDLTILLYIFDTLSMYGIQNIYIDEDISYPTFTGGSKKLNFDFNNIRIIGHNNKITFENINADNLIVKSNNFVIFKNVTFGNSIIVENALETHITTCSNIQDFTFIKNTKLLNFICDSQSTFPKSLDFSGLPFNIKGVKILINNGSYTKHNTIAGIPESCKSVEIMYNAEFDPETKMRNMNNLLSNITLEGLSKSQLLTVNVILFPINNYEHYILRNNNMSVNIQTAHHQERSGGEVLTHMKYKLSATVKRHMFNTQDYKIYIDNKINENFNMRQIFEEVDDPNYDDGWTYHEDPYDAIDSIRETLGDNEIVNAVIAYMSTDQVEDFVEYLQKNYDVI